MKMHQAFVTVNEVPTKVMTWGRWIEETPKPEDPKDIIICVPGNPGITRFYTMFLQTLYEKVGLPIWIIGHAGHELPINRAIYSIPELKSHENLYGLKGQIDHKVSYKN